jgi:hypothetical protein
VKLEADMASIAVNTGCKKNGYSSIRKNVRPPRLALKKALQTVLRSRLVECDNVIVLRRTLSQMTRFNQLL